MKIFGQLSCALKNQQVGNVRLRGTAAAIHISCTFCVALVAFLLIRLVWYPDFFWQIAGGSEFFLLICSVDAALGPSLTFAVFNPAKGLRRLKFDLSIIFVLQLVAFAYGLSTAASVRPLFLVYSVDRFNLVTAMDIDKKDLATAEIPQFRSLSWARPQIIGTREPKNSSEKLELIDSALAGRDRHFFPKTYVNLAQVRWEIVAKSQPLARLKAMAGRPADLVREAEARHLATHSKLGFVPVIAQGEWVMLVDGTSGELLEVLPIDSF